MPLDMVRELQERMDEGTFRIYIRVSRAEVYEAILRVEPGAVPWDAPSLCPLPLSSAFDADRSGAWPLLCCRDAVKWNVPVWLACFDKGQDGVFVGDSDVLVSLREELQLDTGEPEDEWIWRS